MDKVLEMLKKYLPDDVYCCETPGVIHYFPNEQEMYEGGSADGIHLLMDYVLKQYKVDRAEIVCFGNNLYGKEIVNLWENYPEVDIHLMVCSPTADIMNDYDKKILSEKICSVIENGKTRVWATESPPTLRSCVLYSNGEPIFCCVQHYLLSMISEHITGFIGRQTPCIMLYHSNDDCMLKHYVKYCEDEYNRLKGEDAYQPIIKNNGEIGRLNEEID